MAGKEKKDLKHSGSDRAGSVSQFGEQKDIPHDSDTPYHLVIDDLPDPVFIFRSSRPNTFLDCNLAVTEKYGYSKEEILTMTPEDLHPAGDWEKVNKNIQDEEERSHEYVHIDKSGNEIFVNTHSRRIKYKGVDAQVTVVRDITRRKQVEKEYRTSEQLLRNIIEFLPDATFVIDRDKKVLAWNKALERITGILKEDILGKDKTKYALAFYDALRPTLADLVEENDIDFELYDSIAREGTILVAETFASKLFNGKGADVWAAAAPFYDKDGHFLGAIESIRDITEIKKKEAELAKYRDHLETLVEERTVDLEKEIIVRRQAEKELIASERKLDTIIKTVPDIIYRLDTQGKITFISESVKQYGYEPGKLLGTPVIDLVHSEDKDIAKDRLNERRTRDRRTRSFEVRLLTKDQKDIPFEIFSVSAEGLYASKKPVQSAFIGTQGIARDITARKTAEAEREKLIEDLRDALENVKTLSGLVPICSSCKKIRDDNGYWNQLESYLQQHLTAKFSHGMCPECSDKLYGDQDWYIKMKNNERKKR